ncbi:MAG: hypothetical protein KDD47_18950 [Acidobacteria bacterium]|nr:hypothetical protein [Acidobacteriota bacterium]
MSKRHILSLALAAALVLGAAPVFANTLAVTNAAAITGSFGLELTVDASPTVRALVIQDDPGVIANETHVLMRVNAGNLLTFRTGLGNSRSFIAMQVNGNTSLSNNVAVGRFYIISKNDRLRVRCHCRRNNDQARFCSALSLNSGATTATFEYEWWAAITGNTACAARAIGFGEVSVNNINSDLTVVNAMRLGLVGSLSIPANAGSIYFDDFESFR